MRKIILVNQKGGCGKTTTAVNVAFSLSAKGAKVLLIDLDPQGHAGLGLGLEPDRIQETIYEVLRGEMPIRSAIRNCQDGLDVICSNVVLSAFEQAMAGQPGREYKLSRCLAEIEDAYDFLIIDSPPGVGLLTFNGLLAAAEAIIPVDSSPFSLHGVGKLLETIKLVGEQTGHDLDYKILATNVDRRTRYGREVIETLRDRYPDHFFKTVVNCCTRLREAAAHGQPIAKYDAGCAAFRDYNALTAEIAGSTAGSDRKKVTFSLKAPHDAVVQIAGDFTLWEPEQLNRTRRKNGHAMWQKTLLLRPGTYQYKYLVDGSWMADPQNEETVSNAFGSPNSIIRI